MKTVMELLESCCSNNESEYSSKIARLMQEVPRLTGLVESKDSEVQTMPRLVEDVSRLRKELAKAKGEKDGLSASEKVVLALGTENSGLMKTTGSLVGSL